MCVWNKRRIKSNHHHHQWWRQWCCHECFWINPRASSLFIALFAFTHTVISISKIESNRALRLDFAILSFYSIYPRTRESLHWSIWATVRVWWHTEWPSLGMRTIWSNQFRYHPIASNRTIDSAQWTIIIVITNTRIMVICENVSPCFLFSPVKYVGRSYRFQLTPKEG